VDTNKIAELLKAELTHKGIREIARRMGVSTGAMKLEVNRAVDNLDAALKKYDRYVQGKWPKGQQVKIYGALVEE
jgi:DNA-directed RNA polymerase specialized sigma24 family protein